MTVSMCVGMCLRLYPCRSQENPGCPILFVASSYWELARPRKPPSYLCPQSTGVIDWHIYAATSSSLCRFLSPVSISPSLNSKGSFSSLKLLFILRYKIRCMTSKRTGYPGLLYSKHTVFKYFNEMTN